MPCAFTGCHWCHARFRITVRVHETWVRLKNRWLVKNSFQQRLRTKKTADILQGLELRTVRIDRRSRHVWTVVLFIQNIVSTWNAAYFGGKSRNMYNCLNQNVTQYVLALKDDHLSTDGSGGLSLVYSSVVLQPARRRTNLVTARFSTPKLSSNRFLLSLSLLFRWLLRLIPVLWQNLCRVIFF